MSGNEYDYNAQLQQAAADTGASGLVLPTEPGTDTKLRYSLGQSVGAQPDYEARLRQVAADTGVPIDTVRNVPSVTDRYKVDRLAKTLQDFPETARLLTNPDNAKIAHDDTGNLTGVEKTVGTPPGDLNFFTRLWRQLGGGALIGGGSGLSGRGQLGNIMQRRIISDFANLFLPTPQGNVGMSKPTNESLWGPMIGDDAIKVGGQIKDAGANMQIPAAQQTFGDKVAGMLGMVGETMGEYSLLGPIAGTSGMYGQGADMMADKVKGDKADWEHKDLAMLSGAGIMGVVGKMGLDKMTQPIAGVIGNDVAQTIARLGIGSASEAATQFAMTAANDVVRQKLTNENAPIDWMGAGEQAGIGGATGAIVRSLTEAALRVRGRGALMQAQAKQAEQGAARVQALNELATTSKVLQRDPQTFEQFVEQASDGGPLQNVYIDANALRQSGVADQVAALSPAVAEQLPQAERLGGTIAIPTSEYTARIAPHAELTAPLLDHLRTEPDGMSRAEAREALPRIEAEQQAAMDKLAAEAQNADAFRQSADQVKESILQQLTDANRFTKPVNDAYASIEAAYYASTAAQMGELPHELYARRLNTIQATAVDGKEVYRQSTEVKKLDAEYLAAIKEGDIEQATKMVSDYAKQRGYSDPVDRIDHTAPGRENTPITELDKIYPDDIYSGNAASYYGDGRGEDAAVMAKLQSLRGKPNKGVTVYRAVPKDLKSGGLRNGDWVSLSESYVRDHGESVFGEGNYKIISKVASAKNLFTDGNSIHELGYDDGKNYVYKDTKNYRKVNDVITRDENGEVIPLSKRFDSHKDDVFYQSNYQQARGSFDPATLTSTLLKNADLSTFLHESGHFFFENHIGLASELLARGEEGLTEGHKSLLSDVSTMLKYAGIDGPVRDQVNTWHNASPEERRAAHEKIAESFERYMIEGKAPSLELQSAFSRVAAWMTNVYRSLKEFISGHPEAGQLSDEVRAVFDRMLATRDQIQNAEYGRSMVPLFESAEQARMTPQEFADYQNLGIEASNQAVADLQARGMRDMAWAVNARNREILKMQRESRAVRKYLGMEARRTVMEDPLYPAWEFLTRKLTQDDKAAMKGPEAPKETHALDPSRDSLWTAIAKLGGLDRTEVEKAWGWDAKERTPQPAFGKPLLRREGGKSIAGMEEALAEHGYLTHMDDPRELEDRFFAEYRGDEQYSANVDPSVLMGSGDHMNAEVLKNMGAARLGEVELREMNFTPEQIEQLQANGMVSKTGVHPDLVADMYGLESGEEMVKRILASESPKDAIASMTDRLMLENYSELSSPEAIQKSADAAIHNDVRARMVATEYNALARSIGAPKIMREAAKQLAEQTVGRQRIRDLQPSMYANSGAKAARNAMDAEKAGDLMRAAAEKRNQAFAMYAAKAANDARDEVEAAQRYLVKFDRESVRKNIDVEYREQIDALLDRYDLRKISNKEADRRQSLALWAEKQAEMGYDVNVPESLLNEASRTPWRNMTVDEFRGLRDSVKQIEKLGRLKNELLDGKRVRDLNEVAAEAKQAMSKLPQRNAETNRGLSRMSEKYLSLKSSLRSAEASLLKMEQMGDWLDNRDSNGAFNRMVFRPLADAGVRENDMMARIQKDFRELVADKMRDVTRDGNTTYTADKLIDGLTGKPQKFTKKQMLMLAGNVGNESNLSKLARGEGWQPEAIMEFLNQHMSKADWDYVAGMGKTLESLWPEKVAMLRRMGQSTPDKVAPRAFDTPHGRYEGWYWPLVYDPARAQDVHERGARHEDQLFENVYSRANTDTGRANTRVENYARPLLLDLDALPRVIREEVHDITHREAIINADKFLSHKDVRDGIVSALSQEHYDQLRPWLQSIANDGKLDDAGGRANKFFNDVAHGVRTRATMVGLGYRLTTMLVHGSSAGMESVAELGPKWFASGLKDFANPTQWAQNKDFVFERSGEMRNRMNEVDRDIREHLREIDLRTMDAATSAAVRGADIIKAHAYQGIAMLDMASALPTWLGAYKKAMAPEERGGLGMSEDDAVYFADKTVRNAHGGTGVKDMAAVQRGTEFMKLFTMYYTFWNHNVNRIMDTARMAKSLPETYRSGDMAKFRGDLGTVIMRSMIYTFGVQIMHAMLHPPQDDDGETNWALWAAKELTMAAFGGIPIARDLVGHWVGGKDYNATPAQSMVQAITNSGDDAMNAAVGKEVSDKWLKHTITTTGYVFGLPTGQPGNTIQFLWDVASGHQDPTNIQQWWNGVLHGEANYSH